MTQWGRSGEFARRFNDRDWEWIEAFYDEDVVFEDRRAGMGSVVQGRAEQIEHMKVIVEMGATQKDVTLLAERGDAVLMKVEWEAPVDGGDTYEIATLMLTQFDASDRCI